MRATVPAAAVALLLLCACAAPNRPQAGPGAAMVGSPRTPVDAAVVGSGPRAVAGGTDRDSIRLPDRITLPASYRLVLLDGHLVLVRETDPQTLLQAPSSMRIVMGELARGELAYQPALLPQELAAEVAANRESSARMDNALEAVMRRSRELSEQSMDLQAQSRRLAELLSAAQARIGALEAASPKARPGADGPHD